MHQKNRVSILLREKFNTDFVQSFSERSLLCENESTNSSSMQLGAYSIALQSKHNGLQFVAKKFEFLQPSLKQNKNKGTESFTALSPT